jgi:hypothetical protein
MKRARMTLASLLPLALATACHASVEAKASTSGGAEVKADEGSNQTTSSEPASTPAPPPPQPAAPPPADKCPLGCFAASGADRLAVTKEEHDQLESALEPVLAKMRSCTAGVGDGNSWRRHGSPTIHLRVEPDGAVHEVDVDPGHPYDYERQCIDDAARGSSVSIALPGRTAVRCVERCEAPRTTTTKKKRR